MPTPFESGLLNLHLFDLRREPVLREARSWFLGQFNPQSFSEVVALASGDRNASFRMVLSYWEMAASLVVNGAIDGDAFRVPDGNTGIQPHAGNRSIRYVGRGRPTCQFHA
jgi:hypothetical protein